jgi:hypothetical protein
MGELKFKLKWPCGLKYEVEVSGFGAHGRTPENIECPLHGKKCLEEKKKNAV